MTAPTPLAISFTFLNTTVREGPNHLKAFPAFQGVAAERVGAVQVDATGGRGVATVALVDQPDWDTRSAADILTSNAGNYVLHPRVPPIPGIESEYAVEATDLTKPTPAKVKAHLRVESAMPPGWTLLRTQDYRPDVMVRDSTWQVLDHGTETLPNRDGRSKRSITWHMRTNVNDGRILIASTIRWTASRKANTYRIVLVFDADTNVTTVCNALHLGSSWCNQQEAESVAKAIGNHFPPHRI